MDKFITGLYCLGSIAENQILIAKNRDFYPGNQKFITVNNAHYKFFGLYGDNQYDKKYILKWELTKLA